MSDAPVRVRIAPSPTGDPHVGTAYQAVFNYAFAHGRGGKLVLRIEDTDQERSTPESEHAILKSLRWLGIPWDEGPDVGGPFAPYRQSERTEIYREHTSMLLEAGNAYRCFCTRERLEQVRAASSGAGTGYDRNCRGLSADESSKRAAAGESFVVRMKVPLEGECAMRDLLRGVIRKDWATVDDQVVLKSDGFPTYHLANVVDDHLMGITHVIRGEEWINSLPKHLQLYEHFGWQPPVFCHLPLLRNPDKSKLSKRKNPTSIRYYRRAGFLPEALRNYLGLMGWTMPGGEEKFTLEEMSAKLKLEEISLGGPVFDVAKLKWLNGRYIREDFSDEALLERLESWALGRETLIRIVPLVHKRLDTLADWGRLTVPFFTDEVVFDPAAISVKGKSAEEALEIMQVTLWRLEKLAGFDAASLKALFEELSQAFGVKLRDFCLPFYVALAGSSVWTPIFDSMEVLGSDLVRLRVRRAIAAMGGLSAKKLKAIEERHAGLLSGGSR